MTVSPSYRAQCHAQYDDRWECEHDDYMTADDYDARRYERDGWGDTRYERQRF